MAKEEKSLFCKLNKPSKSGSKTPVEQKHIPIISLPKTLKAGRFYKAKIKVGETPHPNENEHFIQWLEFYVGDVYLGRFDFTPVMTKPEVTVPVMLGHPGLKSKLRAVARCNLHGLWEGSLDVTTE